MSCYRRSCSERQNSLCTPFLTLFCLLVINAKCMPNHRSFVSSRTPAATNALRNDALDLDRSPSTLNCVLPTPRSTPACAEEHRQSLFADQGRGIGMA